MKSMPYTPVGPVEHTIPNGMCPNIYECPACLEQITRAQNPKCLTEVECAAERWHAAYFAVQPVFASMMGDLEVTDEIDAAVARQAYEAKVWARFMKYPHASEVDG